MKGIDVQNDSSHRRRARRVPRRLDDTAIIYESIGYRNVITETSSNQYKVNLYYPVLDSFMAEIDRRFNSENIEVMRAAQCFSPDSPSF